LNKSALIVGGAGFTGRAVTSALAEYEYDLHVIARDTSSFSTSSSIQYYQTDIMDFDGFDPLLESCSEILYFASDTTPGASVNEPQLELQKNLSPLLFLIKYLQKYKNKHLIYLSSGGTVYGNTQKASFCEEECFSPSSYYGAGKIAAEAFLKSFQNQYGNQVTIFRPSNFYGVGQPYKAGFGVIRSILECLYNNETFQIWGDGQAKRDYINIQDFVSACMIIATSPPPEKFNVFNVGSGYAVSLLELVEIIEKTLGKTLHVNHTSGRSCDIERIALDCLKLQSLNWQAAITLETGILSMWEWLCAEKKT